MTSLILSSHFSRRSCLSTEVQVSQCFGHDEPKEEQKLHGGVNCVALPSCRRCSYFSFAVVRRGPADPNPAEEVGTIATVHSDLRETVQSRPQSRSTMAGVFEVPDAEQAILGTVPICLLMTTVSVMMSMTRPAAGKAAHKRPRGGCCN